MVQGIAASEGIIIGKVFKYHQIELAITKNIINDIDREIEIFQNSIAKSIADIKILQTKTEQHMDTQTAKIFSAHIAILNDPEFIGSIINKIKTESINSDYALKSICDSFVTIFDAMENEYIKERASDVKDVSKRVLMNIQRIKSTDLSEIGEEVILVAEDLTPSDTAQLNKELIKGFITNNGGRTSHSAIMARTLQIPAVVGTKNAYDFLQHGEIIILDGFSGRIITQPTHTDLSYYQNEITQQNKNIALWNSYKDKKSISADGKQIKLCANIDTTDNLESVFKNSAEGIGLFRTECLYLAKNDFPTEDEQFAVYKSILKQMNNKPVMIRTLDIGGDKKLEYFQMENEQNPFLGNRAFRLCMTIPEVFKTQLKALLRASVYGNLHIIFPMIATVNELHKAKSILKQAESEILMEGKQINPNYKIGIMVEIPATAVLADVFAQEVDFFSIGTNDLIQYTFAADRTNYQVSYLYQPCNPSILRLIAMVTRAAHENNKFVSLCGEMGNELDAIPLLLGLGLDELSMNTQSILKTRHLISKINYSNAKNLAENALLAKDEQHVKQLITNFKSKFNL